jgi:hypothetical protein
MCFHPELEILKHDIELAAYPTGCQEIGRFGQDVFI